MTRPNKTCLLLSVALLSIAGVVFSQTSTKRAPSAVRSTASKDQLHDIASEYIDLLQGLRDIVSDYSDYLGSDGLDSRGVLQAAIEKFNVGLDDELYLRDNVALEKDLAAVRLKVAAERDRLAKASDARSQREGRVLRNFNRELEMTEELLAEHSARLKELSLQQDEIANSLDDRLSMSLEKLKKSLQLLEKNHNKTYVIEMPAVPKAPIPTIPNVPPSGVVTPTPPKMAIPPIGAPAGVRGMPKEFNGTMTVTSSSTPIYISNPSGNIELAGWGESNITVVLEVEIAAGSRAAEKELIDQIRMKLTNNSDGYRVSVDFPKLSDPKTRIVNSRLAVNVPFQNKVIVENAFGEMDLSDLRGGVDASGNVSQIEITSVRGGVSVRNAMGTVSISDVAGGPIKVNNSYGDVTVSSADGPITMQNAFANVKIEDSHGEMHLVNSGGIDISSHEGNVFIENSYGNISLADINGNVEARNAFQSIDAQSISGSAKLANQYGSITAEVIGGGLIATNAFGSIDISEVTGRLDLNSSNSSLRLNLDGQLAGASSVIANSGSVYLNLGDSKDLLLKARIDGGSVSSGEPIELTTDGQVKTVLLRLGSGRQALTLQGIGSSLVIARE